MNCRFLFLLIFICSASITVLATVPDSTNLFRKEGYNEWSKSRIALRGGLGIQKRPYTEIGLARHRYYYERKGFAANAFYAAFEWMPIINSAHENIYGLKAGYEINIGWVFGLETKYQTNGKDNDVLITPKFGIGVLDAINLFYGYNISLNNRPFPEVGKHQFSLVTNLNAHILQRLKEFL